MPEHGSKNGTRRNVDGAGPERDHGHKPQPRDEQKVENQGRECASSRPCNRGGVGGGDCGYFNRQDSPPILIFTPARTVKGSAG